MKCETLGQLEAQLGKPGCSLVLVVGKDHKEALRLVYKAWGMPTTVLPGEEFSSAAFLQEMETIPLFSSLFVHLTHLEKIKAADQKVLVSYANRPNPAIRLLLSAEEFSARHALVEAVEEKGTTLFLKAEKPWEKEKRIAQKLQEEAKKEGISIDLTLAQEFVHEMGSDIEHLQKEWEKLLLYVNGKREIRKEDIRAICCFSSHPTLWNLGDAIFHQEPAKAFRMGKQLLEEEVPPPVLLSHLRHQFHQALAGLALYTEGGEKAVTEVYPALKGTFLKKKLQEWQGYGVKRCQEALTTLFETELQYKNGISDFAVLLDLLFFNLTQK